MKGWSKILTFRFLDTGLMTDEPYPLKLRNASKVAENTIFLMAHNSLSKVKQPGMVF